MSILSTVVGFFTGGSKTSEKLLDIADKAIDTSQERSERDAKDLDSARALPLNTHDTMFDVLVDGVARLVRPFVTFWLIGGFIGWWVLPRVETISEYWQNIFMLVLTFWFGGRAILKDLPAAINLMREK